MELDRALVLLGVLAAAVGGYLTALNVGMGNGGEINPLSGYHFTGVWFPVAKVTATLLYFGLVSSTVQIIDNRFEKDLDYRTYLYLPFTALLTLDALQNLTVWGWSTTGLETQAGTLAVTSLLLGIAYLYRDHIIRHRRTAAAGLLLAGVLLIGVPAVDAQEELIDSVSSTSITNGGNDIVYDDQNFVYVSNGTGLHVLNGTDLTREASLTTGINQLNEIELDGNTLWGVGQQSNNNAGLFEIDVTNPQNPSLTNSIDVEVEETVPQEPADKLAVDGNTIYVHGSYSSLSPTVNSMAKFVNGSQTLNKSASAGEGMDAEGDLIFTTRDNRIFIYNETLHEQDSTGEGGFSVLIGSNVVYQGDGGVDTWEKQSSLVQIAATSPPAQGDLWDVVKRGDYIYGAGTSAGVARIDVSDPTDPTLVEESSPTTMEGEHVAVNDSADVMFTSSNADGVVYRGEILSGEAAPNVTDGSPTGGVNVKPQPTLSVQVNDSDFADVPDEKINVSFYDFDSGDFIDNTTLTSNGTASVTWSSADHSSTHRWLAIATDVDGRQDTSDVHSFNINNEAPTLTNPTPRNDALRTTTGSVTLEVDVTDPNLPDNDTVNVSWWDASNDQRLDSVEANSNGTVTGTWSSPGRGYHTYYVNATDNAGNTFTTALRRFKTPGELSFYDASNGNLITDTINVQVTGPGSQEDITVTDGTFEWEDKTNLQDTEYSVQITSSNYATATFTIQDVALSHNIYLASTSQDITFDLNDNSGDFPGGDSQLIIAENIDSDGDATNITAQNYFGSDNTVTFSLQQGETYELYVENTATGDGRHVGTYTVPASSDTQTITISRAVGADWRIDDATASPSGTVENASGGVPLSINITNMDSNDIINVSFYNASNDDRIGSQEVTGSGTNTATQNWDVPPGVTRSWYVIASDENNVQRASNTFAFGTAGSIVIRDADTGNLITDTVTLNITRADGQTFDRSVTSGFFNWTNLSTIPQNEVSVEINESDHFATQLQLNTVAQNNTVFLVQMTGFTGTNLDVTFVLNDLTGNYQSENTTLEIRRSVSGNYTTVASGTFGAANLFGTQIESGVNYRLRIENNQGDVRELGSFETNKAGTYTLDVGRVDWNFTDSGGYTWDAFMSKNDADQDIIRFQYNDTAGDTEYLDVQIYEQGNESQNTIYNQFDQGPFGEKVVTVQLTSDQADKTWVVEWEGERNGEVINGSRIVGGSPFDVPTNLDPKYLLFLVAGLILFTAGLGADENSPVIGVMVVGVAGMLWYLGWFEISVGILILAAILAIANKAAQPGEV